jgi:hypothetical protein
MQTLWSFNRRYRKKGEKRGAMAPRSIKRFFTDAVLSRLKTEREVVLHFNLIEILAEKSKKNTIPERTVSLPDKD